MGFLVSGTFGRVVPDALSPYDDSMYAEKPTTPSEDLLAAGLAALMVFGAGLLVLFGWAWLGPFGGFLGAVGAVAWFAWWRKARGAFFPRDLTGGSVGGVAVLVAIIGICFVLVL